MANTVQPDPLPSAQPHETAGLATALRTRPRVALAHDWLCGLRGGERVLDSIIRLLLPDFEIAGLFVMFDDGRPLTPAIDAMPRVVSGVGRWPWASTKLRRWMLPFYPAAVGGLSARLAAEHARSPIDLVISTSSAAIKGLAPPAGVPHLCYIHSPARYVWSLGDDYERGSPARRAGLRLYRDRFKAWDKATAAHVTQFVANSTHTAAEVRRCYGRDAAIVYPPARTDYFTPPQRPRPADYWLIVSALEPYKRVDLAIAAANTTGERLVVLGDGSRRKALARMAGKSVELAGRVPDEELRACYRDARLLLFPQVEDFGIASVEAQACGCPVVAYRKGGALDTVQDGVTGRLFDEQTVDSLIAAARSCPANCDAACRLSAERFSEEAFAREFRRHIDALLM